MGEQWVEKPTLNVWPNVVSWRPTGAETQDSDNVSQFMCWSKKTPTVFWGPVNIFWRTNKLLYFTEMLSGYVSDVCFVKVKLCDIQSLIDVRQSCKVESLLRSRETADNIAWKQMPTLWTLPLDAQWSIWN